MTVRRVRIDFASTDAARFNVLRDLWCEAVQNTKLSKSAYRVAWLISGNISREFGYAFPTNEQLADGLGGKSLKTVDRAIGELDNAGLVERETRVKRDEKGEAVGKERRIFPTVPEVNGHSLEVNGHAGGERTFGRGEWTDGVSIPLTGSSYDERSKTRDRVYAREENVPSPFSGDIAFIDAFDRALIKQTGGELSGDVETVVRDAFDAATNSDSAFMPFYWASVRRLSAEDAANWFLARARRVMRSDSGSVAA